MVVVEIGPKSMRFNVQNGWLFVDGEKVSKELKEEFEEEVLGKKIEEASGGEVEKALLHLGSELNRYLMTYKDSWIKWKEWAEQFYY